MPVFMKAMGVPTELSRKYCYKVVNDPDNAEFPVHPDKVSKIPNWTDRKLGGIPVFHLYGAVFGFCAVYIFGGLLGALLHFSMDYMHYASVIGLAAGYLLFRFAVQPFVLMPFEQADHERQKQVVSELLEILEIDENEREYIEKLEKRENAVDRAVYEDDE